MANGFQLVKSTSEEVIAKNVLNSGKSESGSPLNCVHPLGGCIGVTYVNGFFQRFLVGDTCTVCMKACKSFRWGMVVSSSGTVLV